MFILSILSTWSIGLSTPLTFLFGALFLMRLVDLCEDFSSVSFNFNWNLKNWKALTELKSIAWRVKKKGYRLSNTLVTVIFYRADNLKNNIKISNYNLLAGKNSRLLTIWSICVWFSHTVRTMRNQCICNFIILKAISRAVEKIKLLR